MRKFIQIGIGYATRDGIGNGRKITLAGQDQISKTSTKSSGVYTPKLHGRILRTGTGQAQTTQLEQIEQMFMSLEELQSHKKVNEVLRIL